MTDWQTAKARAIAAIIDGDVVFHEGDAVSVMSAAFKALRDSGYLIVRASDPPQRVRDVGFQAHANGGPKAFGAAYEAMVKEMARETQS